MKFAYRTEHNAKAIAAFWGKPIENKEPYIISSLADEDNAELFIFDILGFPFNDINAMIREVSAVKAKSLLVRVNSPGGDIIDTFALYQAIKNHPAKVTVRIEALAASAASILALAGDEVQAYPSSLMMIHNSLVMAVGNRFDLAEICDLLEKIDANMQDIYTAKTKIGKREMADMMKAETWLSAKEMKEKGFIDAIIDGKAVKAAFDLSIFANVPEGLFENQEGRELTRKETEHALRKAGASREYARAVAAKRADASDEIEAVAAEIKKTIAIIGGK
ncbi:MAG TPA: head maturation protease, ClpP-related [Dissulfurispiraceae bacterium]|nr:head maturation protease, ClpP-related [Dissulfurispiraceae bacterium]